MPENYSLIQLKRGTTAVWTQNKTTVLAQAEPALEFTVDGKILMKIGDGLTTWENLKYFPEDAKPIDLSVYAKNDLTNILNDTFKDKGVASGLATIIDLNRNEKYFTDSSDAKASRLRYDLNDETWHFERKENGNFVEKFKVGESAIVDVIKLISGIKPTNIPENETALYNPKMIIEGQQTNRLHFVLPNGNEYSFVYHDEQTDKVVFRANDGTLKEIPLSSIGISDSDFLKQAKKVGLAENSLADIQIFKLDEKINVTDTIKDIKKDILTKADTDLQNVDFTRASRFENAVNTIAKHHDITPVSVKSQLVILPVATSNIDFNLVQDDFLLIRYQMTSNNQELTQMLPPLSDNRTIIFEKFDSAGISGTTLVITPDGTDLIDGKNQPLRISDDGILGVLFNAGTTWSWMPYPILHENGFVLSDDKNNIFIGDKNVKFAKSTLSKNGEELTVTPDSDDTLIDWENLGSSISNHRSKGVIVENPLIVRLDPSSSPNKPMSRLYIEHDYYERKHGEGIFAKLSHDTQIDLTVERTDKIWFDELRVGQGNTFVYSNMSDKSFVIQDLDPNDDPNVTGGTLFLIAFDFQPKNNEIALGDGYLEIKAVNTATGDYIIDVNGNPIQSRIDYKSGDIIKSEFLYGVLKATASTNCAFEISGDLNNEIMVSSDSCILIQSILHNEVDGLAYLGFCNYTGYRWTNTNRYYGNGIVWFGSSLQKDEILTIVEPNSGQIGGNGIFSNNAGRIQAKIQNHILTITDNGGTDLPVFCLGKLFDATDSRYIKGKDLETTISLKNQKNTFVMSLMGWEGQSDKANYRMLTGFNGTTPQFITNWSEIETYQIDVAPNLDLHLESYTFTIPNDAKYTQFALIVRPYSDAKPLELEISNLDANLHPNFNMIIFDKNIHISEEHLKYDDKKYRFETVKPSWASAFRYTVNQNDTKMPWGIIDKNINGNGLITNDESWRSGVNDYQNEGDGAFKANGHVVMSYEAIVYCGENVPTDGTSTNNIWLSKIKDDGTFEEIPNSKTTFILHKDIKNKTIIRSKDFEFDVSKGDKIRVFAKSSINDGAYLQVSNNNDSLLTLNIDFNTISIEQEISDNIGFLREETFIDYRYKIPSNPPQITSTPTLMPIGDFYYGNADILVVNNEIIALEDSIVNGKFSVDIKGKEGNSGQTTLTLQVVKTNSLGITTNVPNAVNHYTFDYAKNAGHSLSVNCRSLHVKKGDKIGVLVSINNNQQYYYHNDNDGKHDNATQSQVLFNEINLTEREAIDKLIEIDDEIVITDKAKTLGWYIELDVGQDGKPSLSPKQKVVI